MTRAVIWSPDSEKDIEIILDYLAAKWNHRVVAAFLTKIENTIQFIQEDPHIFPIIHKKLQIRKSVLTKHNTLYYREKHNKIEIIRIFDSRQNPSKLQFTTLSIL